MPIKASISFEPYLLYDPVLHKKENRYYVYLINPFNKKDRTSTSYARYLFSVKLGRRLSSTEEVDHIDNNKLNDELSNLQVLSPEKNRETK